MKRIVLIFSFYSLFCTAWSQEVARRNYETKFTASAPVIDGRDDDACWNEVSWEGGFTQLQPEENKPPSQQTEFKILYDDNNLYVLVRAWDTEPAKISRLMSRRDNFQGDMVEINIDSHYDKQTAFSFTAMASGTKGDEAVSDDGNNWDESWNPVWYLGTSVDDKGWIAEFRIPYSQLRFGKKDEQVWGLQVMRHIHRLEERSIWQYIPKGSPGQVHLFGELHGIKNIKPKLQVELLPYALAKTERFEKEAGNPFMTGKSSGMSAGLDGKVGITNDLTLDFTINPDFGQVEADPSEVNLTAFETHFQEKRPFFIEGKSIYDFSPNQSIVINDMHSDNLFYSRRIGRYPHNYPSLGANEYAKMPEATTILGAAKLSGKTKDGLSIGVLESVTSEEQATIDNLGVRRKETVEPLTNYFVGRLQKDYKKGETVIGGMVTAVNRDINNPELLYLPSSAYTGGVDFQHNWKERTWYVAGNAEFSYLKGTEEAMINLQRSSARYYQRPDAKILGVDSTRTSLSGFGGTVKLGKSSKKHLQFETSVTVRTPGLELNDIGYMRYSNIIHHGTWVGYYIRNPFWIFNNFFLNMNYWAYWDQSGKKISTLTNMNFNSQFKNRWRINGSVTRVSQNISTSLLRGGPSFIYPGGQEFNLNLSTDQSKKVILFMSGYRNIGDAKSENTKAIMIGGEIKPLNSLSLSFEPQYFITNSLMQYVSETNLGPEPRYIFGEIDQKTLDLTFRINYTINPELTIEYYAQPFVSAGKYSNFKHVTNPAADKFADRFYQYTGSQISLHGVDNQYYIDENTDGNADYTFGNPDYNFRQFRSNMVVRWEYKPGSTLYLVWSQGRTGTESNGMFRFGDDMKELFKVVPHNVFLVKFSYWFAL